MGVEGVQKNYNSPLEISLQIFYKSKLTIQVNDPIPKYLPKKNKNIYPQKSRRQLFKAATFVTAQN